MKSVKKLCGEGKGEEEIKKLHTIPFETKSDFCRFEISTLARKESFLRCIKLLAMLKCAYGRLTGVNSIMNS